MTHVALAALALLLGASLAACSEPEEGDQSEGDEASPREATFDGAQISAELAHDPQVTYFVDTREGAINYFDQSEEMIDFSSFLFQCPSMPAPVPMEEYLEAFDEDFSSREYWSIRAADDSEDVFRWASPVQGCTSVCPYGGDVDCVTVCWEAPAPALE